jgi:hypothetical protein
LTLPPCSVVLVELGEIIKDETINIGKARNHDGGKDASHEGNDHATNSMVDSAIEKARDECDGGEHSKCGNQQPTVKHAV